MERSNRTEKEEHFEISGSWSFVSMPSKSLHTSHSGSAVKTWDREVLGGVKCKSSRFLTSWRGTSTKREHRCCLRTYQCIFVGISRVEVCRTAAHTIIIIIHSVTLLRFCSLWSMALTNSSARSTDGWRTTCLKRLDVIAKVAALWLWKIQSSRALPIIYTGVANRA